ncbi:hypothetical protein BJ322DRAFT_337793 [Thelephora terrestris]|uniref:Secreted protein n=1 Tax=Thelephora terrestris TaxID=56493 RepID=A0A9P6H7D9_9AGAM|nr:hypothetical protein BJ322DRAFT_337793 [Thelephora terrestris]
MCTMGGLFTLLFVGIFFTTDRGFERSRSDNRDGYAALSVHGHHGGLPRTNRKGGGKSCSLLARFPVAGMDYIPSKYVVCSRCRGKENARKGLNQKWISRVAAGEGTMDFEIRASFRALRSSGRWYKPSLVTCQSKNLGWNRKNHLADDP